MRSDITAIAPWFGAKRTLAPQIIAALGTHRSYWEPFCGSMAVLLAKPRASSETVNDLHGDLINLARVIQDDLTGPMLYRRLRRTALHEDIFAEAREELKIEAAVDDGYRTSDITEPPPNPDRAWAFFVCSWMGRNGTAGTPGYNMNFCVRFSAAGGDPGKRFRGAVDSIPAWRERLRGVTILRRDAFGLLERIADEPGTAIYLDPPYMVKGARYVHDFDGEHHARLADLASRFTKARVVVSYYEHPRVRELYDGWWFTEIPVRRNLAATSSRDGENDSQAVEMLVSNEGARRGARPSGGLFAEVRP